MASAPLKWLLTIGGTTLKTTAKVLTDAVNELHDAVGTLNTRASSLESTKANVTTVNKSLNTKVNKTDVLTLEEIDASTNLTDKVVAAEAVKEVNDSLGGLSFYEDKTGKYVVGADSVPKKLGSGSILPFFMRLNHNNYATFGWYYIGIIVNGKKYQTNSGNYDNNFPSTFKSGTFSIAGHSVYVVGSNLTSSSGQGYLASNVTLKVYVDNALFGTYTGVGMGTDTSYQIEGGARLYLPSNGLVEF